MTPYEQRIKQTVDIIFDPDVAPLETIKYVYNYVRYERILKKVERLDKIVNMYAKRCKNDIQIFNLRKEMADL